MGFVGSGENRFELSDFANLAQIDIDDQVGIVVQMFDCQIFEKHTFSGKVAGSLCRFNR